MAEEEQTSQERTESPTPRRREEARREGRVARSQEVSTAAALLAGAIGLFTIGGESLAGFSTRLFRESTRALSSGPMSAAGGIAMIRASVIGMVFALLPIAAILVGSAVMMNLAQTRGVLSWKPVEPKLSHLNPVAGFRRLFAVESLFTLFKSLAKLAALGLVTWVVIAAAWPELISLAATGPGGTATVLRGSVAKLGVVTGLTFFVIAAIDYWFQLHRAEKSLRMTRQDVLREYRETEGNPLIKGRILSLMRARARKRMLQDVPNADVVIVNPTEIAVALKYDTERAPAPVVVAMGERKLAERIKAIAYAANVTVIENRPVARALLATATIGKPIPPALYAAVAEILAFVYRKRGGLPGLAAAERSIG